MQYKSALDSQFFVSRETWDRLRHFASLVEKWQKSINLVAPSTIHDIWERHILDSLQIYQACPEAKDWLDLGSGAGFPGIVTAICLAEHSKGCVHLVESNQKKAAFLRTAILETGARAKVYPLRADVAPQEIGLVDAISARALASLDELCHLSEPWFKMNENTCAWFHKGRDYDVEIAIARRRWSFDLVQSKSQIQEDSVILKLSNLTQKMA